MDSRSKVARHFLAGRLAMGMLDVRETAVVAVAEEVIEGLSLVYALAKETVTSSVEDYPLGRQRGVLAWNELIPRFWFLSPHFSPHSSE